MVTKSERRKIAARTKRRANIERGMKIMLYELNQRFARYGVQIDVPEGFFKYTIAIAEGGRDDAEIEERIESWARQFVRAGIIR